MSKSDLADELGCNLKAWRKQKKQFDSKYKSKQCSGVKTPGSSKDSAEGETWCLVSQTGHHSFPNSTEDSDKGEARDKLRHTKPS